MILIRNIKLLKKSISEFKNDKLKNIANIISSLIPICIFLYAIFVIIMCYIKFGLFNADDKLSLVEITYMNNFYYTICFIGIFVSFIAYSLYCFTLQKNKMLKALYLILMIVTFISSIPTLVFALEENGIINFPGYYNQELITIPEKYAPLFSFYKNSPSEILACYKISIVVFCISLLMGIIVFFKKDKEIFKSFVLNVIFTILASIFVCIISNLIGLLVALVFARIAGIFLGKFLTGTLESGVSMLGESLDKRDRIEYLLHKRK